MTSKLKKLIKDLGIIPEDEHYRIVDRVLEEIIQELTITGHDDAADVIEHLRIL